MNLIFFITVLIFQISSLICATSTIDITSQTSNNIDHLALLAIKSQITDDPQGVLNSWNDSFSVCDWQGVTCGSNHPRVVGLRLVSYGLVGTLSPSIGNLTFLHNLRLSNNSFRGHIPSQIGHLFRLRTLILETNSFEGEIPVDISQCSMLQVFDLAGNNLTGNFPPELSNLSNLKLLILQDNRLTGDLLNTIVKNMTSLELLSAAVNSFTGMIPENIGRVLINLTFISLAQNRISGKIPASFYNLSSLNVVDFDINQLEGTVPLDIGFRLPQLTDFKISENFFHGNLPASLSNLTQLWVLAVYANNFTGKFTFDARNMLNLENLDISLNYLGTGESDDLSFLQTLVNSSQLQHLECSSNNFGGILPRSIGSLSTNLTVLDFQLNKLTGSIPVELFNLVNLERLGLSDNQFTGNLPPQIEKLRKLESFDCSNNHLIGNIPSSLGNLSYLSELYLANNNFEGAIPSSLGECTNLLYLMFSANNLSGVLPPRLFHASMILKLHLDQNHLQGIIPKEIDQLRNLVMLDVSGNGFSGEIPSSLGSCTGLIELDMGENFFNGSIPQSLQSLTSLRWLNLSHNRFSGQIPNFLSNFSLLGLDLSSNNLEGEVPKMGAFGNLSALTISGNNKLCGGIPELHLPRCLTNGTTTKEKGRLSIAVIVIITVASLVVGVSIMSAAYFLLFSGKKTNNISGLNLREPFSKISYSMLLKATNRFSEANLVGVGGFGSVYKGILDPESGLVVAIKVINLEQKGAAKGFMAECDALRKIRHRNLLKVLTVCSSTDYVGNDFKALVYEFMPNGNLQQWIHIDQQNNKRSLDLLKRVNIALDVAFALDYLHNRCDVSILHCDLKPSNILLDHDMVAHVGDFGLATYHVNAGSYSSSSVTVKGTVGYAAPEYGLGSTVSIEGDTYSYGIVLIEMITAKSPTDKMFNGGLDLHKHAKSALYGKTTNIFDPALLDDSVVTASNDYQLKCVRSLLEIGVKCSMESPQDRMRIEDAIKELQLTRDMFLEEKRRVDA